MANALLLGFLVGFPIAATPGPMFFLVLRRTLTNGWSSGLFSGAGIATGDGIYAAVAAFGITALINLLVAQRRWIGLIGGLAIVAIGVRTLLTNPFPDPPHTGEGAVFQAPSGRSTTSDYLSTLGLTLANPPTMLSFLAVFAAIGVRVGGGWASAGALVIGVLMGSAAWWMLLTGVVAALRKRISPLVTRGIALGSGGVLIAFGLFISLQSL